MEKFREYARLKEERLRQVLSAVEPDLILKHLSTKMFKSKSKGYGKVLENPSLLLEEVSHSRLISALRKMGYPFYTSEMKRLRNELYRENYGLICKAVQSVAGSFQESLFHSAVVYFLEAVDNLRSSFSSKPQTYVFGFITGRLKEEIARRKGGMTILSYLKGVCGYENAEELLAGGKVFVNGRVIYDKNFRVRVDDEILIEGESRFVPPSVVLLKEETPPSERLEREEFWREVRSRVGDVNEGILRAYAEGRPLREIAEELGISLSAVKTRLEYSLRKLKEVRDALV